MPYCKPSQGALSRIFQYGAAADQRDSHPDQPAQGEEGRDCTDPRAGDRIREASAVAVHYALVVLTVNHVSSILGY